MPWFWVYSGKGTVLLSLIFISLIGGALTACSPEDTGQTASSELGSSADRKVVELTPELVTIFSQDCAQCHTKASTGAPLVGDIQAWREILSKGLEATLERTFNGYGGMPPAGRCFECSPEQLTQLIRFMSQGA